MTWGRTTQNTCGTRDRADTGPGRYGRYGRLHGRFHSRPVALVSYCVVAAVCALALITLPYESLSSWHWVLLAAAMVGIGLLVVLHILVFKDGDDLRDRLRRALAERDALQTGLQHLTLHDGLTGLPNRVLFDDRIRHECHQSLRDQTALGLMLIDLGDLGPVSARYGPAAGDTVLVEIAGRLHDSLRRSDTVARVGQDQFAVLLHNPMPDHLDAISSRVCAALDLPIEIGAHELRLKTSIGLAITQDGRYDPVQLLNNAERNMYRAKGLRKSTRTVGTVTTGPNFSESGAIHRIEHPC